LASIWTTNSVIASYEGGQPRVIAEGARTMPSVVAFASAPSGGPTPGAGGRGRRPADEGVIDADSRPG
jgi:molecular chaperone DnaK (HSP70)